MATREQRSFAAPDERRTPPKAEVCVVRCRDPTFARVTYYPGLRWTQDMAPVAGTALCQVTHFGYVLAGRCHVVLADGTERDLGPGELGPIRAGHDAWVLGEEPLVSLDLAGAIKPA